MSIACRRAPKARLLCAVLVALSLLAAPAASATRPRTSLSDVEQQVMCVTCNVPLAVAESPQANRERAFINSLIARGETLPQIKRELVAEFGPSVLALPKARGFDIAVYVVPAGAVALVGALVALAALRWRRRGAAPAAAPRPLDPVAAERLEQDLARYD